jgi:glutamate-ammonia-ligase adenylyltransferase
MALTRARVVAGDPPLCHAVEVAIVAAIAAAGPAERVRADAAAMRARMARDAAPKGPPFALGAVKLRPGGLVDVEFIAQSGWLAAALPPNGPRPRATRELIEALREAGCLSLADAAVLRHADFAWRTVLGMMRLVAGRDGAEPVGAAAEALLRVARAAGLDAVDVNVLRATLDRLADQVRSAFVRLIGAVEGPP